MVDSNQIWTLILDEIKTQVKPAIFERWFSQTKPKSVTDRAFTIEVPNIFYKHWINEHYQPMIEGRLAPRKLVIDINNNGADKKNRNSVARPVSRTKIMPGGSRRGREGARFNPKYTFDNFIEGASNRFARAGCMAVAQAPAKAYNPLFIYGGVGLGKTHLMQAVGQYILKDNGSKTKVHYISSEKFTRHMILSLEKRKIEDFRRRYRTIDCLLIDDIQFLSGKERTQEEFFHTFNSLFEYNSQIVVSCDCPPRELKKMEERLTSRFQWGLVVDLQPPDFETRVAILLKNAQFLQEKGKNAEFANIELPETVAYFLARKIKTNIRQLEGALIRVVSYAALLKVPLTVSLAEKVLQDIIADEEQGPVSLADIQKKVAEFFDIRVADMKSNRRPKNIAHPRQIAMYLARELTDLSLQELGEGFGGKDHSTIIYGHKATKKKMDSNPKLRQTVQKLKRSLSQESAPLLV